MTVTFSGYLHMILFEWLFTLNCNSKQNVKSAIYSQLSTAKNLKWPFTVFCKKKKKKKTVKMAIYSPIYYNMFSKKGQ